MRNIIHFFILIMAVSIFALINFSTGKKPKEIEIVLAGKDTLGKNWDNLPSAKEIEQATYHTVEPSSEVSSTNESNPEIEYNPVDFTDRAEVNKGNYQTIVSSDGREIIVE